MNFAINKNENELINRQQIGLFISLHIWISEMRLDDNDFETFQNTSYCGL